MTFFLEDTKQQLYWDEVIKPYIPISKVGQGQFKRMQPFLTGDEEKWLKEIAQIELAISLLKQNNSLIDDLDWLFAKFNDVSILLDKIINGDYIDPLTDGYQLKQFLWFSYSLSSKLLSVLNDHDPGHFEQINWLDTLKLPWEDWLELFHPRGIEIDYYPHFSLQDIDDTSLKELRRQKRSLLKQKTENERIYQNSIKESWNITLNHLGYLILSAKDDLLPLILKDSHFQLIRVDREEYIFALQPSANEKKIDQEIENIESLIKNQEKSRFKELLESLSFDLPLWIDAHEKWGNIEIVFKKAQMAIDYQGVKPSLADQSSNSLSIIEGYHPYLNTLWKNNQGMSPLSLTLTNRVTVLYGANMSGKTIALRTVGLLQALAQFGFYVPAKEFRFSFVAHISLMSGDYQDIAKGLSSFAAEVIRIKEDLSFEKQILYLLDEVGKGTNPLEGEAITVALINYLQQKPDIFCVLVTHFPNVIQQNGIELYETNKYKLKKVEKGKMVFEAISVAAELGLPERIVNGAKEYLRRLNKGE